MLTSKHILISCGPTRVYLDPIRFISNVSSGKMGRAFAAAAMRLGAEVVVVAGPTNIVFPKNITHVPVETNGEMQREMSRWFRWADIVIAAAAVVDFAPRNVARQKIKRTFSSLHLTLSPTIDIIKTLAQRKKKNQILVGFALETKNLLRNAQKKIHEKKLDYIIANQAYNNIGTDTARVTLIGCEGKMQSFDTAPKEVIARKVLNEIVRQQLQKNKK